MVGYLFHVRRYFSFVKDEWIALLATAATGAMVLGFLRHQPGDAFSLGLAIKLGIIYFIAVYLVLTFQVLAYKLAGIRFGFMVIYDKYALGLLFGVFLSFMSFGFIPFWVNGVLTYKVIPNLRIGKFRASIAKNWEMGLTAAAGPLATVLLTVPLNWLYLLTGLPFIRKLIVICVLVSFFAILPLPLIQTANPYTVYMSRLESLENNLPGYDLFFASRIWYAFAVGMVIIFSLLALVWQPSPFVLIISILLGFLTMFLYTKARLHFA